MHFKFRDFNIETIRERKKGFKRSILLNIRFSTVSISLISFNFVTRKVKELFSNSDAVLGGVDNARIRKCMRPMTISFELKSTMEKKLVCVKS